MESIVGQTVSHYEFLEKLGAGGMGEIYKARDSRLNRTVAVKVLAPGRTRDPERRRRFIQEAQAASALNHPNIITIHDILPEGDTQYMVMEHVSGKTLHQMIAGGRLPVSQALLISTQMANALAVAHAAGIIHRDLKPANVMVTGSGLVKILDFGLAKLMDPTARLRSSSGDASLTADPVTLTAAPLTVEGSIMGTVNYMSPEQAEGLKVDARSDIFSFGAVLYEMVTGQRAFDGDSGISTLSAVLRDDVKPIRLIASDVPPELDDLIARCLRKNPDERWQSMTDVAAALNNLRARLDSVVSAPAPAPPAPVPPPASSAPRRQEPKKGSNKKLWAGVAGAAVVALAAAGAWLQVHKQSTAAPTPAPAPVATTAVPAPQPVPPPAPAEPAPENTVPEVGAPPPSTPIVPLVSKLKTPAPPPVVTAPLTPKTKAAAQPQPIPGSTAPVAVSTPPAPRAPAPAELVPVKLNDGLPFRIALLEDVPVDVEVGHALRFRVVDGVQADDVVVIAKGAIVTGSVAALGGKRNFFGERSKMRFRLTSAESVDDSKVSVRATPAPKSDGEDSRPFETNKGLKDKSLIAASGAEYVAYVAGDQTVSVHK
ncbi:MAG TPA: serine/threonine-protein kinase [Bryobacteraceae bacterium]|nr:serine/threonine-protein kinase [Bryobacteraceae bacterium]